MLQHGEIPDASVFEDAVARVVSMRAGASSLSSYDCTPRNRTISEHARCDPVLWRVFDELSALSAHYNLSLEGDTAGGTTTHQFVARPAQARALRQVVLADTNGPQGCANRVRTVCETGFNAGHSAAIWLEGTDVREVHSFDLFSHTYSNASARLVSALYPGRFKLHPGNTLRTVHHFAARASTKCDLWYIDGGHVGNVPASDMLNALASSHNQTLLIADDCSRKWMAVRGAFESLEKDGSVRPHETLRLRTYDAVAGAGWCAGLATREFRGKPLPSSPHCDDSVST